MIPFDEMDARLEGIQKNRAWLVHTTGRSTDSIRAALAPNAKSKSRSELLQKALSDAIEREEATKYTQIRLPDQLALQPTSREFDAWCKAYKASDCSTLKDWAVSELNKAAKAWMALQTQPIKPLPSLAAEKQA